MASTLKFDQWQSTNGINKQPVIQVVRLNITSVTFSAASYTTGYTLAITPTSVSSQLLHMFWAKCDFIQNSSQCAHDYNVNRNGVSVWSSSWQNYFNRGTVPTDIYPPCDFIHLDSPASVATQTYDFQGRKYGGSANQWICGTTNGGSGPSGEWVIMEIAG